MGEEGGVSVLVAETWNSGRRAWELGRHSDSLRRVYHVGKRPNLLRTLARWASAGVSMWVPSGVAMCPMNRTLRDAISGWMDVKWEGERACFMGMSKVRGWRECILSESSVRPRWWREFSTETMWLY